MPEKQPDQILNVGTPTSREEAPKTKEEALEFIERLFKLGRIPGTFNQSKPVKEVEANAS